MNTALAVIPARFGSTRFPGKPLADRTGKPLIAHVIERVRRAERVHRILVATDDRRIFDAVRAFGAEAVMTRSDHPNGTSRIAEVAEGLPERESSLVVNVQGDEPEIEPRVIDMLVEGLLGDSEAPMATLASTFAPDENPADPNIVKLVMNQHQRALYFSRSLIPYDRDARGAAVLKHPGLYAYRREFLLEYVTLPPTPLERAEQLEQLRALEHGYPIAVVRADVRHHGIDTPEQYEAFVRRHAARAAALRG
jgi:3-deoxy-manno-octulosonate cytidylyltransferase (CMP-KDO synthetase)